MNKPTPLNKPLNVLCFVPTPSDATSWYRGVGPIAHLKSNYNINAAMAGKVSWPEMYGWDVVFMQRPVNAQQLAVARLAKELGKPLWLDYDDDLMNVPDYNKAFGFYQSPQVQTVIQQIWSMADVITVTTKDLKKKLDPFCKNVVVVRNAYDPSIYQNMKPFEGQKDKVSWRGTDTHIQDIMAYTPAILKAMEKHQKWETTFLGYNAYWIGKNMMGRYEFLIATDVLNFMRVFYGVRSKINIVPLEDNTFNRAKSNIAWLESILCGAVSIVPDWEEWQIPGTGRYSNLEGFYKSLDYYMSNPDKCLAEAKEGRHFAEVHFNLDLVNQTRWQILNDLFVGYRG